MTLAGGVEAENGLPRVCFGVGRFGTGGTLDAFAISRRAADDFERKIRCTPRFHDPFAFDDSFSSCWDGGLKKAGEAVAGVCR